MNAVLFLAYSERCPSKGKCVICGPLRVLSHLAKAKAVVKLQRGERDAPSESICRSFIENRTVPTLWCRFSWFPVVPDELSW